MNIAKSVLFAAGLSVSGSALSECPIALPVQALKDCIVVEGAGGTYPVEKVLAEVGTKSEMKPTAQAPTATVTAAAPTK